MTTTSTTSGRLMTDPAVLPLAALCPGIFNNLTLVHPQRPQDEWRIIAGGVFVLRPGRQGFEPIALPSRPPDLAIDYISEDAAMEIDTAILRQIYDNGEPPQPMVRAARLIIYKGAFGFAEIRDDCAGCGNWSGRAAEMLHDLAPTDANIPEARRRLALLVLGKETSNG